MQAAGILPPGLVNHPTLPTDPMEGIFALCHRYGWRPDHVLDGDWETMILFQAYVAGAPK